jgi:hypothetical protein
VREAAEANIRLDPSLWPTARGEQQQRLIQDPFYETLQPYLEQLIYKDVSVSDAKISSEAVWTILDVRGAQRTQDLNQRMGKAMRDLGWRRPNKANLVSINGKSVVGYVKGGDAWPYTVEAIRDRDGLFVTVKMEEDSDSNKVPCDP